MKKRDWILIGSLLALALILLGVFSLLRKDGAWVVVRVDGVETARYRLDQDGQYELNGGTNVLRIQDGQAWLVSADCPDLLCVKQGKIRYEGQTITCLPNRLTVTVYAADKDNVDLVSN